MKNSYQLQYPVVVSLVTMLKSFTRSISIVQIPQSVSAESINSTVTSLKNIQNVDRLTSEKSLDVPVLNCLGNPQTVLSIDSPPSVPIYVRRGSLLSIFGENASLVRSSLSLLLPWKSLLYGGINTSYQKLISVSPFSILVSSSKRSWFYKNSPKTFAKLVLDGKSDWAILNKNALHMYAGNSLIVGMYRLPSKISKKLAKRIGPNSTGLVKWNRLGYTLLSGRGQTGLVGSGTIYNINVADGEELLINHQNLLAVTVSGPHDLQNCIVKYSFPVDENAISTQKKDTWSKVVSWFSGVKKSTQNLLVGNQEFVKIIGPRNLLIQSNTDLSYVDTANMKLPSISSMTPIPKKPQDYLSYATVTPEKHVKLESTPDFKETIEKLDKK